MPHASQAASSAPICLCSSRRIAFAASSFGRTFAPASFFGLSSGIPFTLFSSFIFLDLLSLVSYLALSLRLRMGGCPVHDLL